MVECGEFLYDLLKSCRNLLILFSTDGLTSSLCLFILGMCIKEEKAKGSKGKERDPFG